MKVIAIASGGMDSTTMLWHLRAEGHLVRAIGIDYGQKHRKELIAARLLCESILMPFEIADLRAIHGLIAGESSQMNPDIKVPEGHYAEESMKSTIVPNRNMIMLSIAIGHAIATHSDAVAYGAHSGDHAIYPDCRKPFADAMDTAARLCDWEMITVMRPFIGISKADIVRRGFELNVPFEKTWSCYNGAELHCGKCGTCVERKEAFMLAEIEDKTKYIS
jgi:7-cyano-7-deazaguanine synthase